MNVSGAWYYLQYMYNQEKYVNKKLDPQKKSVHSISKCKYSEESCMACCTTDDTYKVHFRVISFAQAV